MSGRAARVEALGRAGMAALYGTRDLYLFKPLLVRLQTLETAPSGAKGRIGALEAGGRLATASALKITTEVGRQPAAAIGKSFWSTRQACCRGSAPASLAGEPAKVQKLLDLMPTLAGSLAATATAMAAVASGLKGVVGG